MFLKDPVKDLNVVYYNISKPLMFMIGVAVVATVASIFFVQPLISYITEMVSMSAYTVR
jgi:NADH-quinone oxidoreductase subunit N